MLEKKVIIRLSKSTTDVPVYETHHCYLEIQFKFFDQI